MDTKTLTNIRRMLALDIARLEAALASLSGVKGDGNIIDAYRVSVVPSLLHRVAYSVENVVKTCLDNDE